MDKPLLEYQIERLRRVKLADEMVIATTTNDTDLPVVSLCQKLKTNYFRGSECDVLERYYKAARDYKADCIVRITSDCPFIDPDVIDEVISLFLNNLEKYDYVSNTLERSYPRGLDTEICSFAALEKTYREAKDKAFREHVTLYMYKNPNSFRLANVRCFQDQSAHRWTVDTIEDFELIKLILEELYPLNHNFSWTDVIKTMNNHPDWMELNALIKQKEI